MGITRGDCANISLEGIRHGLDEAENVSEVRFNPERRITKSSSTAPRFP